MSHKSKGINAERSLIHLFWKINGWAAIRVAGSGSMKYPSPDIIAGNNSRKLVIECKALKGKYKYFEKQEVEELLLFAEMFDAEPWFALRFDRDKWYFLKPKDLKATNLKYVASFELAKQKGVRFDDLVSK